MTLLTKILLLFEIFNYQTNEELVTEQQSVKETKHLRRPGGMRVAIE